jgi:hypothetical protein
VKSLRVSLLRVLACGLCLGGGSACQDAKRAPAAAAPAESAMGKDIAALKADIQTLKDKASSASVAMADVSFANRDSAQFPVAYKAALESCYSCHKSVGRPYLRPQIPKAVPQTIVNLDPNATWPQ